MLYYVEICLSPWEVPKESSICIYIAGCQNHCVNCHYPELQKYDDGYLLRKQYFNIVNAYLHQATCVCFLGEGKCGDEEKREFLHYVNYAHQVNLKTCLYSGRDIGIESWMDKFDFVKVGSYQSTLGGLNSSRTNQIMLEKMSDGYRNINHYFVEMCNGSKRCLVQL